MTPSPPITPAPARAHLLIIDDRIDELRLLLSLVRQEDYRISVAFDGAQGYHRAQALRPDLILMDVSMPVLNGFDACRLLRSDPSTAHIPIIFLSSASGLDARLEGLNNGGVDYVIKPYDAEEVLARIKIHLRRPSVEEMARRRPEAATGPAAAPDKNKILVDAACRYLSAKLAHPPSLAQVARAVNTSEKRLAHAFRSQLGISMAEFIRQERLRCAARLLRETTLSITQVAEELGYSSSANFATAFRMHTGQTPSNFRSS